MMTQMMMMKIACLSLCVGNLTFVAIYFHELTVYAVTLCKFNFRRSLTVQAKLEKITEEMKSPRKDLKTGKPVEVDNNNFFLASKLEDTGHWYCDICDGWYTDTVYYISSVCLSLSLFVSLSLSLSVSVCFYVVTSVLITL